MAALRVFFRASPWFRAGDKVAAMKEKTTPKPPLPTFGKHGLKGFIEDVSSEMRKVVWPTRDDVIRLTGMVLAVCIVFVLYLFIFERVVNVIVSAITGEKPR